MLFNLNTDCAVAAVSVADTDFVYCAVLNDTDSLKKKKQQMTGFNQLLFKTEVHVWSHLIKKCLLHALMWIS